MGEIRIEDEVALSKLQEEQLELDQLLDERGRINLDFTISSSDAEATGMDEGADDENEGK